MNAKTLALLHFITPAYTFSLIKGEVLTSCTEKLKALTDKYYSFVVELLEPIRPVITKATIHQFNLNGSAVDSANKPSSTQHFTPRTQ